MSRRELSPVDHFASAADIYAAYRPHYPAELFEYLATLPARRKRAWDCAAGSGQATIGLCAHFAQVIATDASVEQLRRLPRRPQLSAAVSLAEASAIVDRAIDLMVVAQALHWFRLDEFFAEAKRALAPGGVIAVWTYGNVRSGDAAIDRLLDGFYRDIIGPYWPAERRAVERGYRDIIFPFAERPAPTFEMSAEWTLGDLLGYVRSWSAVGRYRAALHSDPVALLERTLGPAWGDADRRRGIRWPLSLRVGM